MIHRDDLSFSHFVPDLWLFSMSEREICDLPWQVVESNIPKDTEALLLSWLERKHFYHHGSELFQIAN